MEHHLPLHPESLLEHGPRLRALARRLVQDGHAADDLVQETWLRAVEHGPGASSTPWSWLARVLRNLAFQGRRLEAHRAERERGTARREGEPEQRFSGHKELVAAIDRLAEPYRQAILLRYFEDLPPRTIAAQLGVPVKTVKTRLNRGLALLREELDRSHGGRETWLAALAPMLKGGGWGSALAGTARMAFPASTALEVAGIAVVISAGVYLVLPERGGSAAALAEPAPAGAALASPLADAELAPPPAPEPSGTRVARGVTAPASPIVPPVVQALSAGTRPGRVLDPNGNGLAGVLVGFEAGIQDAPEPVVSGTGGAFELPDLPGEVLSRDERFASVLISCLDPARARPEDVRVVVVAPAVTLGGIVRDEDDQARAAAHVRLEIPLSVRGRFREILDDSREGGAYAETDEAGRFLLAGVAGLGCANLVAWSGHERSTGVSVPEHDDLDLELVLSATEALAPGPDAVHVTGEVRRQGGAIAPGALVSLAGVSTRADAQGLFELRVAPATDHDPEQARQLVAVARGEQAAVLRPEHDANGAEVWPAFATLWLGGTPRSIGGRLIGTDGETLAGAPVWIDDLTYLGATHSAYLTLEHQLAGKPEDDRWFVEYTDAEGRFELDGLGERSYTLAAMDPATLLVARVGPIAAGSPDVEIRLSREDLWERVVGHLVDSHGQPLAGQEIEPGRVTFRVYSFEGGLCYGADRLASVQTDENGRFELRDVPRSGMTLRVTSQAFAPVGLELETIADPLDVRFELVRLGHVQIELAGATPEGGSILLLDEHDESLNYYVFGGGSLSTRYQVSLGNPDEFAGGRTPVMSVPETARAAVLRDGEGNELRRVPLTVGEGSTSVQL